MMKDNKGIGGEDISRAFRFTETAWSFTQRKNFLYEHLNVLTNKNEVKK